jgi:uncharacterized protein (TIGR04552 family)
MLLMKSQGVGVARDILHLDTSFASAFSQAEMGLQELEAARLILQGNSVIDWHKLDLGTRQSVDDFLRIQLLDPEDSDDQTRLRFVFNQSVSYLEEHLGLRFPADLRDPKDVRDVFIAASTYSGRFRRHQTLACMILKLMHVINHMEAADLKFQMPISEAELLDRAEKRIITFADQMRKEGHHLVAFYGSRKTRTSMITKLLSKRETIAATVFDKLRFRIITEEQEQILPVLGHLTQTLLPFNYVIPDQSQNNLVQLRRVIKSTPHFKKLSNQLQRLRTRPADWLPGQNPFSGDSYRMVNFISDFPVRVDEIVPEMDTADNYLLGKIVYVLVEFQIVDRKTADANELGENAHKNYKSRQKRIVESRLLRGSLSRED